MFNLISPTRALDILGRYSGQIQLVAQRYNVPEALIKAILYREMTMINLADTAADLAVQTGLFKKKDSSTGYGQIFGYVGLNAINFAVDLGLATYESLGIESDHRLDPENIRDVRLVWKKLHASPNTNIEVAALNLLAAANEKVGRLDFDTFSDEELKLVATRYNADTQGITPYGEQVFQFYKAFNAGLTPDE